MKIVREYRIFEVAGGNTLYFCASRATDKEALKYIRDRLRDYPDERYVVEEV